MTMTAAIEHHSPQDRKRQLAGIYRILLGYCDAGSGIHLPKRHHEACDELM